MKPISRYPTQSPNRKACYSRAASAASVDAYGSRLSRTEFDASPALIGWVRARRLTFGLFLLASLFCLPHFSRAMAAPAALPDTSKMNLLFIIIEDCYAGVWGSYGNPICQTPNMDRFARTAVQFDAAYVQAVCCNPSRTSFLTGLRPLTTRVWGNPQVMSQQLPPGTLTLPELLKKKGLHTAVIGKFFHTPEYAHPQLMAFDRIEHYQPPPDWKGPGARLKFPPVKRAVKDPAPKDKNSQEFRLWRKRHSDRYGDSGLAPEEEGDYRISQTALALLEDLGIGGQLLRPRSRPRS